MTNVASEIAAEPLLFSWDSPLWRRRTLAAFVVLSVLAHALCFYVFQIVYPTPVALLPPPARVTFIAPDSEEGRTLLRWIDAEDPAVAFTTDPAPDFCPAFSPDGQWIAFADKDYQLWMFNVAKKALSRIGVSDVTMFGDLAWSPDSGWLACVEGDSSGVFKMITDLPLATNLRFALGAGRVMVLFAPFTTT